jgi:hypothetical protein
VTKNIAFVALIAFVPTLAISQEAQRVMTASKVETIDDLVLFGCEGLLKLKSASNLSKEAMTAEGRFRLYSWNNITFTTKVGEREIVYTAKATSQALVEEKILANEDRTFSRFQERFGRGKPYNTATHSYGSLNYETAQVLVHTRDGQIQTVTWSCG